MKPGTEAFTRYASEVSMMSSGMVISGVVPTKPSVNVLSMSRIEARVEFEVMS